MYRRSSRLLCAVFAGAALIASACSSGSSSPASDGSTAPGTESAVAPGGEKVLRDGYVLGAGNPPHFDPAQLFTVDAAQIMTMVFDGLTEFDFTDPSKPELKPHVAESFSTNADASEFVFTIRKGMVFSNGNPVLPSSFAYAWNRAGDPKLAATYAYLFFFIKGGQERVEGKADTISGVVADDAALTLTVSLVKPYADFASVVSHNLFWPLDELTVSKLTDQSAYDQATIIGNGPFKMVGPFEKDKGVTLVQNEKYAGGVVGSPSGTLDVTKPNLTKIEFVVSKDLDASYQTYESGQLDTAGFPSGKFKEATAKYPFFKSGAFSLDYYVFRADDPVVGGPKNEKLRQAMSMAIDRVAIADAVCQGSCLPADSVVPPGIPGYLPGLCTICAHDLAGAKKLLADWKAAGGQLSAPIVFAFNSGAGLEDTINIIQANLAELGVEVVQKPISSDTYFGDMAKDPAQFFRLGWAADYPLYDNFTGDLFASTSANNYQKLNLPDFDAALEKARATTDVAARAAAYQAAERLVVNTGYALPLSWGDGGLVFSKKVKGLVRYPSLMVNYDRLDIG